MKEAYKDIISRIDSPPLWWDECGVPRFDTFHPRMLADIYAHEAALCEVACQSCGCRYMVAFSQGSFGHLRSLADCIRDNAMAWGDPPNTPCCAAGATMTSDFVRVVQYWHRGGIREWEREHSVELAQATRDAAQPQERTDG